MEAARKQSTMPKVRVLRKRGVAALIDDLIQQRTKIDDMVIIVGKSESVEVWWAGALSCVERLGYLVWALSRLIRNVDMPG